MLKLIVTCNKHLLLIKSYCKIMKDKSEIKLVKNFKHYIIVESTNYMFS